MGLVDTIYYSDLLFFVPRSLWPGKALSGSYEVATARNLFSNLSYPYPALGYIDAGVTGVIFVGCLLGFIMKRVDKAYWCNIDYDGRVVRPIDAIYPAVLIYSFIMCRGDILYFYGYMVIHVATWALICWFAKKIMIRVVLKK